MSGCYCCDQASSATIAGGSYNTASSGAYIGGGSINLASGVAASVGGGTSNTVSGIVCHCFPVRLRANLIPNDIVVSRPRVIAPQSLVDMLLSLLHLVLQLLDFTIW